jgi:hypothetical protein
MINVKGNIRLGLENRFSEIPMSGHLEEWKPISEIKKDSICWISTGKGYPLVFGIANVIAITSNPVVHETYVEFDFVDFN